MITALPSLSWFFLFAFALNGLLAISILLFKNKTLRTANTLLAINLLGISLGSITIILVQSRMILEIPHFYRLPSPLIYLMLPAAYLYVKLILKDGTQLEKKDYLHALPALVHLIEMLPYYLLSREEKVNHIAEAINQNILFYASNEGWLPPFMHNILRGCMAVIYSIAMWRLIQKSNALQSVNPYAFTILRWLKTFTIINATNGAAVVMLLTFTFIPADVRSLAIDFVFLMAVVIANFYLFFKPDIFYGLPRPLSSNTNEPSESKLVQDKLRNIAEPLVGESAIPAFIYQYKNSVHEYLLESKRYLEPDFNLHDLSRGTNIPKNHLQLLIHKVDGKKFNEFIDEYRILHLQSEIEKGSKKNKTLEALASESGFSSKASFIRSIKKHTGKTPKEYFIPRDSIA